MCMSVGGAGMGGTGHSSLKDIGLVTQSGLQRMPKSLREKKRMDEDTGKDLPQLVIPLTVEVKFLGLHKWIRIQQRCGNTLVATNFTAAVCDAYAQKVTNEIENMQEDNDDLVKPPKQLNAY
eukprot:14114129-Ditylum_brightwellii.AAC.1